MLLILYLLLQFLKYLLMLMIMYLLVKYLQILIIMFERYKILRKYCWTLLLRVI